MMEDIDKLDKFLQHPWSMMVYGIILWYAIIWAGYASRKVSKKEHFNFKEWFVKTQFNILVTVFCSYLVIVWDDEIIELWFKDNKYEQFSDAVYLLSGPISSTFTYVVQNFNSVIAGLFGLLVKFLGRFATK